MAILTPNAITTHLRGQVGDLVFKHYGTKVVVTRVPRFKSTKPSADQKPRRDLFRAASAYAVIAKTNAKLHAKYAAVARTKRCTPRSIAIRDFMRAEAMSALDFSRWQESPRSVLVKIDAEFAAASVDFQFRDSGGRIVAQGAGNLADGAWHFALAPARKQPRVVEVIVTATSETGRMMQRRKRVPDAA